GNLLEAPSRLRSRGSWTERPRRAQGPVRGPGQGSGPSRGSGTGGHRSPGRHVLQPGGTALQAPIDRGSEGGQLVYYERPDVGGVKESRVLLASIPDAPAVREILARVLPVKAEVRKTREIYR